MLTEGTTIINEEELKEKLTQVNLGQYTKKALNKITKDDINKKIETFGWVWSSRVQPKMTFLELYSGFKKMKCVTFTTEKTITQWSSVKIYGEVKENKGKDEYEFEFFIEKLIVFGKADTFPINSETSAFTMLEKGHLALRTPKRILFLKARSHLLRIMRDFFYQEDCIEITPPTLVQTQVEGGSTLFKLKYYDSDAFLTQSSQLYLETVVPVSNKAFCIMPSYRAEKSNTRRHLSEYTHVEAEFADICFDDLVSFIQRMLIYSIERFYTDLEKEIKEVYPSFERVKTCKVTRMKYSEAIKFLQERKQVKSDGTFYEDNDDIPDHAERYLCSEFGIVILTHFLVEHKPFYMRRAGNETESLDVLFPDVGEIVGGSMRCEDYDELIDGFKREGIDPEPYYWYTDLLKYGTFSHGGFGLGFERLLMGLLKYNSVNKACLYPRFTTRCAP